MAERWWGGSWLSGRCLGNDSLDVGVSAAFSIHITWATSAVLGPLIYWSQRDCIQLFCYSAVPQASLRAGVSLHMAAASDYPQLADFFFPLFFSVVIFSFKDCCQRLSGKLCEAHFFLVWASDLTVQEETEQRGRSDCRDGDWSVGGRAFHVGDAAPEGDGGFWVKQ